MHILLAFFVNVLFTVQHPDDKVTKMVRVVLQNKGSATLVIVLKCSNLSCDKSVLCKYFLIVSKLILFTQSLVILLKKRLQTEHCLLQISMFLSSDEIMHTRLRNRVKSKCKYYTALSRKFRLNTVQHFTTQSLSSDYFPHFSRPCQGNKVTMKYRTKTKHRVAQFTCNIFLL